MNSIGHPFLGLFSRASKSRHFNFNVHKLFWVFSTSSSLSLLTDLLVPELKGGDYDQSLKLHLTQPPFRWLLVVGYYCCIHFQGNEGKCALMTTAIPIIGVLLQLQYISQATPRQRLVQPANQSRPVGLGIHGGQPSGVGLRLVGCKPPSLQPSSMGLARCGQPYKLASYPSS